MNSASSLTGYTRFSKSLKDSDLLRTVGGTSEKRAEGSQNGSIFEEVKVLEEKLIQLQRWKDDPALPFEALRCSLNELKDLEARIRPSYQALLGCMRRLGATLRPFEFGKGLESLPDHLLSYIFELACSDLGSKSGCWTLCHVCRRFRRVALDTPRLWNRIHFSYDKPHLVDLFLKRSKQVGLQIHIHAYEGDSIEHHQTELSPESATMFDQLRPHRERWEELSINISRVAAGPEDTLPRRLHGLRLLRLESLDIEFTSGLEEPPAHHFYTTCELPSLRTLHLMHAIPVPFNSPSLTSIEVTFARDVLKPTKLLKFLCATPSLEEIILIFEGLIPVHDHDNGDEELQCLLPNVKTLGISVDDTQLGPLMPFRRALCTPNVQRILFSIGEACERGGDEEAEDDDERIIDLTWYLDFMLCHDRYPSLVEFEFKAFVETDPRDIPLNTYDIPFSKMPSLRVLTLETGKSMLEDISDDHVLPPLCRLHLKRYHWGWTSWLQSLDVLLRQQGKFSGLEEVVIGVEGQLASDVKGLFAGSHVVWDRYIPSNLIVVLRARNSSRTPRGSQV